MCLDFLPPNTCAWGEVLRSVLRTHYMRIISPGFVCSSWVADPILAIQSGYGKEKKENWTILGFSESISPTSEVTLQRLEESEFLHQSHIGSPNKTRDPMAQSRTHWNVHEITEVHTYHTFWVALACFICFILPDRALVEPIVLRTHFLSKLPLAIKKERKELRSKPSRVAKSSFLIWL